MVVMRNLFYVFCFLAFGCDSERDCCEIINKVYAENQYILVGAFASSINTPDDSNGLGDNFGDVNIDVSQEEYDSYEIGDKYCFE